MTELSTAPLESANSPRRLSVGPWTLISASSAIGLLLICLGPLLGVAAYGWTVIAVATAFSGRLAYVDERTHTLPNRLTGGLALLATIQAIGISWWQQTPTTLITAMVVAGILATVYAALALTGNCGFGDVKYAGALALTVAPFAGFLTLYLLPAAFIISASRATARRLRGRTSRHPHGTSLAIAGLLVMVGSMISGTAHILA